MVIHEVSEQVGYDRNRYRKVVVDAVKQKALDALEAAIAKAFGRRLRYYLVSNSSDPLNKAAGSFQIAFKEDPPGNRNIDIDIKYSALCPHGSEKKLAASVCDGANPMEAFQNLLARWIHRFAESARTSFIDSFFNIKDQLASALKAKAMDEAGLALSLELSLPLPERLTVTDMFAIHFRDYDREENLSVKVELIPDQNNLIAAHINRTAYPKQPVQEAIQRYFADYITLHSFYFDSTKEDFKRDAVRRLNDSLRKIGRQIAFISFERIGGLTLPEETFSVRHPVSHIDDDSRPVNVRITAVMELQDSARYRISGSRELSQWVRKQIEDAVNAELFGASYLDLIIDFSPREARIKQRLSNAAYGIGYDLEQQVVVPEMEPYDWLDYFEIRTEDAEQEFQTSEARFPVKVSIVVNSKLRDFESVKKPLNDRKHIPTEMKEKAVESVAQFLRTISPERFYVRFSQTQTPGERSVEEELKARIKTALTHNFKAVIRDIFVRVEETEITKLLDKLKSHRETFQVEVTQLNPDQNYDSIFRGDFRVVALDYKGWESFVTSMPEIDKIKVCIETSIETEFRNHPQTSAAYGDPDWYNQINEIIIACASAAVRRDFGLTVTIDKVRRDLTRIEAVARGLRIQSDEEMAKQIAEQITELRKKLVDSIVDSIIDPSLDKEYIGDINKQISDLEACMDEFKRTGKLALPGQADIPRLPESSG